MATQAPAASATDVRFEDILAARARIAGGVFETPCVESPTLSALTGSEVFCKLEYEQRTGSFKERGACNALMLLGSEERARGVIAASAGNHALALAYHGKRLGIPVTVVMPVHAPLVKQRRCRELGARVLNHGDNIAEARQRADELVAAERLTYINGGMSLAVKERSPGVRIVGVEPSRCASYSAALAAGRPVRVTATSTLADGLAVPEVGARSFEIARTRVDEVVTVEENQIALAILRLAELEKGVVEGAGAAPLAAFLAGKVPSLAGKRVVLVLCGGNIDPLVFSRVIEHGLAVDGRLVKFDAVISDRPGGLAELATTIARCGASVQEILHERTFGEADVSTVRVQCVAEVRDRAHSEELFQALQSRGIRVVSRAEPSR